MLPKHPRYQAALYSVAEGVGFEPTDALTSLVFKTRAINHSTTLPREDGAPSPGLCTFSQVTSLSEGPDLECVREFMGEGLCTFLFWAIGPACYS